MIDEADRILQIGFEEEMRQIVKMLPKERQTMLFSATQTTKVSGSPETEMTSIPGATEMALIPGATAGPYKILSPCYGQPIPPER